jgi:hypothetical protein
MAGTIVTDAIRSELSTPTVFRNTSGTEIGQLCRAWVTWTGSTGAVLASFNISSITRVAGGQWRPNFSNSLSDANHASTACGSSSGNYQSQGGYSSFPLSSSQGQIGGYNSNTNSASDIGTMMASYFR